MRCKRRAVLTERSKIMTMSSVHNYVVKMLISEMLKGPQHKHRLLVSALHIVIRHNKAHRGIFLFKPYKIERRVLVYYDSARIVPFVFEDVEVEGRLTRIVPIACNVGI